MDGMYQEALKFPVPSGLTHKTERKQTMLMEPSQTPPVQAPWPPFISPSEHYDRVTSVTGHSGEPSSIISLNGA